MCSHDILQHKYQNHSPLTHQQYRAAGVHWLALGRRGGEPVVQQNKAHKKIRAKKTASHKFLSAATTGRTFK